MGEVLFRFSIVWLVLHIILFFVERYRYKHGIWSWYGFKNEGMLAITYIVLSLDAMVFALGVLMLIGYWIFQPVIN